MECLTKVVNVGERLGEIAEVTFDISTENEHNAGLMYSWLRNGDERSNKWLHPKISFMSWRESPRLQTADLLAFEAWKALDHTVGPVKRTRRSWEVFRATQRFETLSYSEDWFRSLKSHIDSGELGKTVGFSESDYLEWLKKPGREHSISNLIHFLDSIGKK